MPIKACALPDRTVRAIETLERTVNTASGPTVTASCADITALIDSIDDLLNSKTQEGVSRAILDIDTPSEWLAQVIRDASSELLVRFHAVKQAMDLEVQP